MQRNSNSGTGRTVTEEGKPTAPAKGRNNNTKPKQEKSTNQPRPQTAPVPVLSQISGASTASVAPENKGKGRKRNRSKSARDQGRNKSGDVDADQDISTNASSICEPMVVDTAVSGEKPAYLTDHEFENLPISAETKRALREKLRFRYMTQVQHDSTPDVLRGADVLVKAKTGTGKTLAFLVPSIEVLIQERANVALANRTRPGSCPPARILVLSPTRELAQQIVKEATALCAFHNIGCVLLVGGTNMNSDVNRLKRACEGHSDIIVATPGRMLAHLKETEGFAEQVKGVKVYIMDEADRLLDMGFKRDIDQITNFLNKRNAAALGQRQTLLFSATVAPEIREIARQTLLPGYKSIDTVGEEVEQTHSHVPQRVMCAPLDQQLRVIVQLIEQHQQQSAGNFKIILFFPTARQTGYYASVLNSVGLPTLEIHSRKSQGHRTKVSEQFRVGKNVIMASSDVSARGMDYPDVSFVLQVGLTDRDQYIHRLGRTARAGKSGTGLLLLAPFEYNYMTQKALSDLPLQAVSVEEVLPSTPSPFVMRAIATVRSLAAREMESAEETPHGEDIERDGAKMAWQAWLGFYNSHCSKLKVSKEELVSKSAEYAATIGLPQIPALQKKTIGKMGLQGVPGLRIEAPSKSNATPGRGGGGGGQLQGAGRGRK